MTGLSLGRPRFISTDETLAWHEVALAEYGGSAGLRDPGMLESALAMPRQGFGAEFAHQFPFGMAAAYAFHIAKNHPFVDGNKRVALLCCGAFLRMNGWDLVSEGEAPANAVLALIDGTLDKTGFAEWLRANCRARPSLELRDFFASLDHRAVFEAAASLNLNDVPGLLASIDEASRSIPLVRAAFLVWSEQSKHGLVDDAARTRAQLQLLVVLYRLAEDMGYDW